MAKGLSRQVICNCSESKLKGGFSTDECWYFTRFPLNDLLSPRGTFMIVCNTQIVMIIDYSHQKYQLHWSVTLVKGMKFWNQNIIAYFRQFLKTGSQYKHKNSLGAFNFNIILRHYHQVEKYGVGIIQPNVSGNSNHTSAALKICCFTLKTCWFHSLSDI